jgi:hypothetical protein
VQRNTFYEPIRIREDALPSNETGAPANASAILQANLATG